MRRLLLALPLILIWGCFSPSYDGPGGFTCKKSNACPEGYTCVGGLCVEEGAVRDGSVDGPVSDSPVSDSPVSDSPVSDGPVSDGPVSDGPVSDGPVSDGPVSDGSVSDTLKPDGPAADTLKPDGPAADMLKPDAPVPDAPVPDTLKPDAPKPDALQPDVLKMDAWPTPMCNIAMSSNPNATTAVNSLDVALDSHGRAHAFWVDPSGVMYHQWNVPTGTAGGAWTFEQIAKTFTGSADRIAATIDSSDVLHVAFRNPADSYRPYYVYAAYSPFKTTTWSTPKKIVSEDGLGDGLDVAANGVNVYIAASRNATSVSDFHLWKVNTSSTPYGLDKRWVQNDATKTYEWGRLAVGPNHIASSFFDGSSYQLQATPVGSGTPISKTVTGTSSGPAPVAAAGSNLILMAHANGMNGLLRYNEWDGKASSSLVQASLTGSTVDPYVVDVRSGGPGLAVMVYRDTDVTASYLRYVTWTSAGWGSPKLASTYKADDVRMATNPSLKQAWMAYSTGGKLWMVCKNY